MKLKRIWDIASTVAVVGLIALIEIGTSGMVDRYEAEKMGVVKGTTKDKIELHNKYFHSYNHPDYKFVVDFDLVPVNQAPDDGAIKVTQSTIDGVRAVTVSGKLAWGLDLNYPLYLSSYMVKPFVSQEKIDDGAVQAHVKDVVEIAKMYAKDNKADDLNGAGYAALKNPEIVSFARDLLPATENGVNMQDGNMYEKSLRTGAKLMDFGISYGIAGDKGKAGVSIVKAPEKKYEGHVLFLGKDYHANNPLGYYLSAKYYKNIPVNQHMKLFNDLKNFRSNLDTVGDEQVIEKDLEKLLKKY